MCCGRMDWKEYRVLLLLVMFFVFSHFYLQSIAYEVDVSYEEDTMVVDSIEVGEGFLPFYPMYDEIVFEVESGIQGNISLIDFDKNKLVGEESIRFNKKYYGFLVSEVEEDEDPKNYQCLVMGSDGYVLDNFVFDVGTENYPKVTMLSYFSLFFGLSLGFWGVVDYLNLMTKEEENDKEN